MGIFIATRSRDENFIVAISGRFSWTSPFIQKGSYFLSRRKRMIGSRAFLSNISSSNVTRSRIIIYIPIYRYICICIVAVLYDIFQRIVTCVRAECDSHTISWPRKFFYATSIRIDYSQSANNQRGKGIRNVLQRFL
mmetsp:Transcript_7505/g.27405  ORF Transcript_7505/g.27405 Transcript_7505/m.27405 type:complete len:137 (-) Transcript_7505:1734-2144(-)